MFFSDINECDDDRGFCGTFDNKTYCENINGSYICQCEQFDLILVNNGTDLQRCVGK